MKKSVSFREINRGRGHNHNNRKRSSNPKKTKKEKSTKNKTLSDYYYYVGSAKSATDCVTVTSYVLNCIRRTHKKGGDVAGALEEFKEVDFTSVKPTVRVILKKDPSTNQEHSDEHREALMKEAEREFDVDCKICKDRVVLYEDNKVKSAALLCEQCSSTMRTKLQG